MTQVLGKTWLGLVFLSWLVASSALAHETQDPPKPIETADGVWPSGIASNTDVIVPLMVTVGTAGEILEIAVEVSLGAALDAAAVEAAGRWRFEPARRDGVPVAARVRVVVRFRAQTQEAAVTAPIATEAPAAAEPVPTPVPEAPPAPVSAPPVARPLPKPATSPAAQPEFRAQAREQAPPRSASELVRERETLAAAPHRTANDLLLVVPGLFVTQHGGEGKAYQIFYRGFDAVHGQDLEIWAGGAPVNDVSNIHGQGYADLHFIMPEVVRSLRVTPGTYDPRQGDFAVAGTVRLDLGYDQPGFTAKAAYGNFGTSRYFLAYRPEKANEGTFAAAEVYSTDGFGPSRAAQRASAVAQGLWHVTDSTDARLLLTAYSGHFASAGVLRLSDIQDGSVNRFATYDPNQGGASTRAQLVGEVKHKTSNSQLTIAPYVVFRTLRLRQNYTGYLTDPNGDSQQQLNDDIVLGGTASYRRRQRILSDNDTLEAGVLVRNDWIDQSQKRLATADQHVTQDEVDARVRALDVAGYFDVNLHAFERFSLRGGIRVDGLAYASEDHGNKAQGQARSSQGAHFGPKATLEGMIIPGLSAVVSYGEGFRSPQARSLAEGETTPFTRVRSFEGGFRYGARTIAASCAAFRTWLSDDLVFDQATVRNERVPSTMRTGVTADATWQPKPWLNLTLNGTYTRAEFRASSRSYHKGDLVPYAPQLVTRADLAATPVLGELWGRKVQGNLGSGISYLTRRPLPYSQFGHKIFLVDMQAGMRAGELGLSARVYNLLDSHWYDGEFMFASNWDPGAASSLVPLRHVTVGAPRTFLISVELYL